MQYPGELIRDNQGWYVCPVFGHVGALKFGCNRLDLPRLLINPDLGDQGYGFNGTLNNLTGISRQKFYEMFKQNPPQGCLLAS